MTERVLQVTPSYPPIVGGIEDHVANLAERLPDHGYDPFVVTPDRDGVGNEEGVYRERSLLRIQKSSFAPGIVKRLASLEYDLLHVHAPFHFGMEFATVAGLARSKPMVVTVHMYDARDTFLYQLYESQVYDRCLDIADRILPTTADYVAGYDAFERNRERVTAIPLGVDTNHYRPVDDARTRLGYADDERVVLFVGAMERHHFYKDIVLLIEAVAASNGVDRLVLVGSGDRVPDLKRTARAAGVADRVEFPGYVADDDLPTYYSAADLFVLPSKADRGEAFGIVLLESLACGTPVIASDVPGVRTVVGDAGLLIPPGEREALRMGIERGLAAEFEPRRRVEGRFSTDAVTKQVCSVYDDVLSEGPNRPA